MSSLFISLSWSEMKCPVMSFEVHGFGVTLDSLYFNAQGYVPELLKNQHSLALEIVGFWVELSFSVSIEAFG